MAELATELGARHAGYGRLSIETEDTTSPARQKKIIGGRIVERSGVYDPEVDYYEDIDKSGYDETVERADFDRLMANLDLYDVIVVYRLDRITRRIGRFAEILKKLQEHNVTLISATESFDTSTPLGQAMVWIIMVFAQMESETIGIRMQSAQDHMVRHGRFRGGQRPFGWQVSNTFEVGGLYLTLNEDEAKFLRKAITDVLAGKSIRSICVEWNDIELQTSRGNAWSQGTLSHMLRNPILIGHGIFGETVLKDDAGEPIKVAEPLIDDITWVKLQKTLGARGKGGGGAQKGLSLLAGIATCALCKRPLVANARSYVCPTYNDRGGKDRGSSRERDCIGVSVDRAKLDPWVLAWVAAQLSSDRVRRAQAEAVSAFDERAASNRYQERRAELSRKLDRLEEDRYDGMYDTVEARGRFKKRRAEIIDELVVLDEENSPPDDLVAFDLPLSIEEMQDRDISDVRRFLMGVIGKLEIMKGTRGSRRPVSERVNADLVEALQGVGQSVRKHPAKVRAS